MHSAGDDRLQQFPDAGFIIETHLQLFLGRETLRPIKGVILRRGC